jgi:hypothetical protein
MSKYLAAIRVNPAYAPAYYNIAVIYSELNRYEEVLTMRQPSAPFALRGGSVAGDG